MSHQLPLPLIGRPLRRARERFPFARANIPTQVAAAKKIAPAAAMQRARVLAHIASTGKTGATRQEIADTLDMKLQSVCGRVRELVLAQSVIEPGETRGGGKVCVAA